MARGICNLCLEEKDLIRKSHIIPDFIYRLSGMFDEKHRINTFSPDDIKSNRKIRKNQTGTYEGNILCANCDNVIIGQYENYARKAIYGGELPIEECPDCINIGKNRPVLTLCKNVDYKKYKLFLLSILFRATISSRDFLSEVNLSDENLEILRGMILNGNPMNYNDFPVLVSTFASTAIPPDIIINPAKSNSNGYTTYSFVFGGMSFLFHEGLSFQNQEVQMMAINPSNVLRIYHFNNKNGKTYLMKLAGEG